MIQFLIDEDVTPRLHGVAIARGYNAYHVQYLGRKGGADYVHSAGCWMKISRL